MTSPNSPDTLTKYYFYEESTQIIYYSDKMLEDQHLIYIGMSNNPKPKMAAAAFMQNSDRPTGYTLKEYQH